MKKILLLFVAILFTSCSNDDGNIPDPNKEDLIGKWKITGQIFQGNERAITSCEEQTNLDIAEDEFKFEFYLISSLSENCISEDQNLNYRLSGKSINFDYDGSGIFYSGRYTNQKNLEITSRVDDIERIYIFEKI